MKLRVGQLFVRKIQEAQGDNTYMVCGIIKTDAPLKDEATHILTSENMQMLESRDVSIYTSGSGFDGVMQSPIWRVKI